VRKIIGFIGSPHDRKNINCSTCHTVHAEVDPINATRGPPPATAATASR
jgi:hypothetical protein